MKLFQSLLICLMLLLLVACHKKPATLFEKISSSHSGITFNNTIVEKDSINPLEVVNIYNGGGVGIGDFNNDGLQDIFLPVTWCPVNYISIKEILNLMI